jgi:hypothetical protein
MDANRHRTQKKSTTAESGGGIQSPPAIPVTHVASEERFKHLLEAGAKEAYVRPWHRIERGLRLNRIRIFIEEVAPQYTMTKEERDELFIFLQKALDNRLMNTLKVVQYDIQTQRILSIKGLEIVRNADGILKASFNTHAPVAASSAKSRLDATRKKKKTDIPSVSTTPLKAGSSDDNKIDS